jgi:1-acyl-sn-glycerol-3-phosphate acyltransferase
MTDKPFAVQYPRRRLYRAFIHFLGHTLIPIFSRLSINGLERVPKNGPLIIVANHTDFLEVLFLLVYTPLPVEVLGADDIPMRPPVAQLMPFIRYYGFIPIKRGTFDRAGLGMALDVLKQNGVVAIFPQGGVWEQDGMNAHDGVSWLSQKSGAPLLPMGFGNTRGGMARVFKLQRPRFTMNIGTLIPPLGGDARGDRRAAMREQSLQIMAQIQALLPDEDKRSITDERYALEYHVDYPQTVHDGDGAPTLEHAVAAGQLLSKTVLLETFAKNLSLETDALLALETERDPTRIGAALDALLGYLDANPSFLPYRFGQQTGSDMIAGLTELRDLCRYAAARNAAITLTPTRYYRDGATGEQVVERYGKRATPTP